jgi:hypothetical protein
MPLHHLERLSEGKGSGSIRRCPIVRRFLTGVSPFPMQPSHQRNAPETDGDGEKQSAKEMVTPMPMRQFVPQHGTQTRQGSGLDEPTGDEDERATKSDQSCWRFRHGFPQGQPIRDARQFARPPQFC